jgi:hypothetical protein
LHACEGLPFKRDAGERQIDVDAAQFVLLAFRRPLSRDVARIIARVLFESREEPAWSPLMK